MGWRFGGGALSVCVPHVSRPHDEASVLSSARPCAPRLCGRPRAAGAMRSSPVSTAPCSIPLLGPRASARGEPRGSAEATAAPVVCRRGSRTSRFAWFGASPCPVAVEGERRPGAPSTGQSRSPAWSTVHRACPRGHGGFPRGRRNLPVSSALVLPAWPFVTPQPLPSQAYRPPGMPPSGSARPSTVCASRIPQPPHRLAGAVTQMSAGRLCSTRKLCSSEPPVDNT